MNHPELLLIPALMLLDYFLIIWAGKLSENGYRRHFKMETSLLSPGWQKAITERQWFNPRYYGYVTVAIIVCIWWSKIWTEPNRSSEGIFGFALIFYASLAGGHLANVLTSSYLNSHPKSLSGELTMARGFGLNLTYSRSLQFFFPLILIAIFSPTPFVVGGLLSQIALLIIFLRRRTQSDHQVQGNVSI